MSEILSEEEQRELARVAAFMAKVNADCAQADRQRQTLEQSDDATLQATLRDQSLPTLARLEAMLVLQKRHRDGSLIPLLLPLWDDPDRTVAENVMRASPVSDPNVRARLHALLDETDTDRWSTAASILAMHRNTSIIDRLLGWFHDGDAPHRNVAFACLCFYGLLERDRSHALLREAWDTGGRDDDDRAMLAAGLLQLGDPAGWGFLENLARRADGYSAVYAATEIQERDRALGLELMLHILDHGTTFPVRWGMVERIAQAAGLPHVWTTDGLSEARCWVEKQQEKLAAGADVPSLGDLRRPAPTVQ